MVKYEVPLNLVECGMCGKAAVVDEGHRHICDVCRGEEHELYSKIRTLIHENLGTRFTINDVADILKADEKKIYHLVESGFFTMTTRGIQLSE